MWLARSFQSSPSTVLFLSPQIKITIRSPTSTHCSASINEESSIISSYLISTVLLLFLRPRSSSLPTSNSNSTVGMTANQAAALKLGLGLLGLCMFGYIVGPPLYWHFMEGLAAVSRTSNTCPPCLCDCSTQPTLSIPEGLSNGSFADCAKRDPEVSEDTEKNFAELLTEELMLREAEASESQKRADTALLEAKKMASQYQKEADKCSSGMETCEEAREKAEAALVAQKKLTSEWERRAREKGWNEGVAKSRSQSQGNAQSI